MQDGYTTTDICKKMGLTLSNVFKLINNGYLIPSIREASGQGVSNIFSKEDLLYCIIFRRLNAAGIPQRDAAKISKTLLEKIHLKPGQILDEEIITISKINVKQYQVDIIATPEKLVDILKINQQMVTIIISLGMIWKEFQAIQK